MSENEKTQVGDIDRSMYDFRYEETEDFYRIESGLTPEGKCTYEACMQVIETESMKAGANVVYLVRVVEPNLYSTCYNITADLYRYK